MKKLHVIYITGLGDKSDAPNLKWQRKIVAGWRVYGVEPEFFQVNWGDGKAWEPKFQKLLRSIDKATGSDKNVGLVAVSAGATMAINAYAARKDEIAGVVLIAGKVNRPEAIGDKFRKQNPAFVTSAYDCSKALKLLVIKDRQKILSRYALLDEMVYKSDSKVPGARNRLVPSIGHFLTIGSQIILGAPSFLQFLRKSAKI